MTHLGPLGAPPPLEAAEVELTLVGSNRSTAKPPPPVPHQDPRGGQPSTELELVSALPFDLGDQWNINIYIYIYIYISI